MYIFYNEIVKTKFRRSGIAVENRIELSLSLSRNVKFRIAKPLYYMGTNQD
jgi:hypothetical protein